MKISRKKALLSLIFLAISGMSYSGLSIATHSATDQSARGDKVVYVDTCDEPDKNGKCPKK